MNTTPIPAELDKELSSHIAMYPRLAARVTHLRTLFDNHPETPLSREAVDLWVEDVKSVTYDLLTLIGNTRDCIRQILAHQETPHD